MQADKLRELLAELIARVAADDAQRRRDGGDPERERNTSRLTVALLRHHGAELLAIAEAAEDLRADAMRLDWLEAQGWPGQFERTLGRPDHQRWFDSQTDGSDYSPTLRAAIDAAMPTLSTVAPVREG